MNLRCSTLLSTLALMLSTATIEAQWQPVGVPGFSAGMVEYPDLAIGPDQMPSIVFGDWTSSFKLSAMHYTGTAWQILGNAGFSDGQPMNPTIRYNSAGVPYVAFRDLANGNRITVMKLEGSTWMRVGTNGPSAVAGANPSLAFGTDDTPYVAFTDGSQDNHISVKKFENGEWIGLGAEGFSAITASDITLAMNSDDVPYVAYHGNSAGCSVDRFVNGNWEQVGNITDLYNARITDLAIDANDVPHIAYNDVGEDFHAKVKKFENNAWTQVGPAATAGDESPDRLGMAMHTDGTIYVAYTDTDLSSRTTVKKYSNGTWQLVGDAGFTASTTSELSIAVDQAGMPYVAFKDPDHTYEATVMRYLDGNTAVQDNVLFATAQLMPNPAQDHIVLTGLPSGSLVTVYDLAGKLWQTSKPLADPYTLTTTDLPAGTYFVQVVATGGQYRVPFVVTR